MLQRKNILIEKELWDKLENIKNIKKKKDSSISISKIIQMAVTKMIEEEREQDIIIDMNLYTPEFVSEDEEDEMLDKLKNISKEDLKVSRKLN